ncbi:hypothetical protein ELH44_09430 [Rhizobium ruizarguesonis]|uniref:hypothetical protein n=1 Tax=Rhizobium ruizarguesonis TaxID=2081791 RepID=UPI0010320C8E|nr:hypothetical protein [Rhizobium ruizarguesonis]TBB53875.1 hypothetical protein ELH44_09430 [Rhizobium ruizarguesonis]
MVIKNHSHCSARPSVGHGLVGVDAAPGAGKELPQLGHTLGDLAECFGRFSKLVIAILRGKRKFRRLALELRLALAPFGGDFRPNGIE